MTASFGAYTIALFKPDAVRRQLVGQIITEIERAGLVLCDARVAYMHAPHAAEFYAEHRGRAYFEALVEFTASGPLYVALLTVRPPITLDVVGAWRALMGPSDPAQRPPGSIRGRWAAGFPVMENLVHGSDSREAARRESALVRGLGYL